MAIIGSIVGGKDAAKSIIDVNMGEAALKGGHMIGRSYKVEEPEGILEGSAEYKNIQIKNTQERISQLTKVLNGKLNDWQQKELDDYSGFVQRKRMFEIDGMRSISATAKLHMVDREHKAYMLKMWQDDAKSEIEYLTGWLDRFEKGFKLVDKMFAGESTLSGVRIKAEHAAMNSMTKDLYADKPSRG